MQSIMNNSKISNLERFMLPPDSYEIFKFGGYSLKDEKRNIETILQYFPNYFTADQLKQNNNSNTKRVVK